MIQRLLQRYWKDAASLGAIALLIVIVFWPALFEGKLILPTDQFDTMTLPFSSHYGPPQMKSPYQSDGLLQSYPWKVAAQEAFRKGEFFYWNPLVLSGYPQYASSRQTYDLFNLLLIPFDLPFAFTLIIVLELFTAGVGMYLLLRVHRRRRAIALMFAIAWTFNGMFLTDLHILWPLATFCWVPFALGMSLQYYRKQNALYLLASGGFLGLTILGATLQSALFALFAFAVVNLGWSLPAKNRIQQTFRNLLVPCGIALALSAVMWVSALELYIQVVAHGTLYSPAHFHAYTTTDRLLSFLLLGTFFAPETMGLVHSASLISIAEIYSMDFSGYLGAAEMLMALWAVFSIRANSEEVRPYAWLFAAGFLLPIFTPLFAWVYHRFFIVGTFGMTVLGAERLERFMQDATLRERGKQWALWMLRIAAAAFILLIAANLIWKVFPNFKQVIESFLFQHAVGTPYSDGNLSWVRDRIRNTFEHYSPLSPMMLVPFGVIAAGSVALWKWDRFPISLRQYRIPFLILLSSVQIVFWWRSYLPMTDPKAFPLLPGDSAITYLQAHHGEGRTYIHRRGYAGRQYLFLDDYPMLYGIPVTTGYESEVPRSFYPELLRISDTFPHPKTLGFLGVNYLVFYPGLLASGTLPMADSSSIAIYADPYARPRAALYYRTSTYPNDSLVLDRIFDENDPHDCVWFTADEQALSLDSLNAPNWEPATIVHASENEVDLQTNTSHSAYLVLTDSYYQGWNCFVDGKPQNIYRCNFNMRAVLLPAGAHRVAFVFWPYTAVIGGWCSFCTFLLLLVGSVGVYWRRKSFPKNSALR